MTVAIMQPYIFPYVGYFQLIMAVDKFIFYDDVDFIKRGWINRNRILLGENEYLFTIPCVKPTYKKKICNIKVNHDCTDTEKLLKTLYHAYSKAPFFKDVYPLLEEQFTNYSQSISTLAVQSIKMVIDYLGIEKDFKLSSEQHYCNNHLNKADRLIDITKKEGEVIYINPKGGEALYDKPYFDAQGVELIFLQSVLPKYSQSSPHFVAGLSIIDVLMNCDKEQVFNMLDNYQLR
ncbi:WbqC family protein [Aliiglaciecola lipolytica]|uniref:WbqC family protein n=1 Tax=Aliiglaciecola lipolytica TaxID=477689 RepID=UPI001C089FFC|nr:WbqC family protein [Aliiglaciecola lipolytica]MBU2878006.1 WbqC family protein [Aliiglaciecola lipolytica]